MFKIPTCSGGVRPPCTFVTVLLSAILAVAFSTMSGSLWAKPTFVNAADPDLPDKARGVPKGGALNIANLELDAEGTVTLELERFSVFAADAEFVLVTDSGSTSLSAPGDAYFRGWANHDPNSIVMLAVSEDGSARGVITGSNGAWLLGTHRGRGLGLQNRKVDLETEFADRTFSCTAGSDSAAFTMSASDAGAVSAGAVSAAEAVGIPTNVTHTGHMIVDTDFEYLQRFGGDPAAALAYLGDLFAYISGLYEREINTNLLLEYVRMFSTNNDPYEVNDSGCGDYGGLGEVADEWKGRSDPRSLVALVSGKTATNGCAFVGGLCQNADPARGYSASMGIAQGVAGWWNVDDPADIVWSLMVVAHEIGHNFGSPHTHNYCNIGGIPEPVDICASVEGNCNAADYPTTDLPSAGSLTGGTPGAGNGTVMSYCHQQPGGPGAPNGGLSNMSWTFGEYHPDGIAPYRVPDTMRAHVADRASCMTLDYEGPDLQVFKDCKPDDPALVGDTAVCTIVVENHGTTETSIALGVVTEDLFVSSGTFNFGAITATKGDSPMDPGTCTSSPNPQVKSGEVSCNLGDIAPDHAVTIEIEVLADGPQNINDRVSVDSESPDPNMSNNMAEDTLTFFEDADLAVTKDCKPDGDLLAGDTGTCTIIVQNFGPSDAENVRVIDTHISNETFDIESVTPAGPCWINPTTVARCNFPTIAAGDSMTIEVAISENEPMDINDTVTVTSDTRDSNTSNNEASDGLHIIGVADLRISKAANPLPGPAFVAGQGLEYILNVVNDGPSIARNVVVEDVLPAGTSVIDIQAAVGYCDAGVPGDPTRPVVCPLGHIAPGANVQVTIELNILPDTRGLLFNTASVSSDTLDPNTSNNQASTSSPVIAITNLQLEKRAKPVPVRAGEELVYVLRLKNLGPSTATGVMLDEVLPPYTTVLDVKVLGGTDDCAQGAGQPADIICRVGTLAFGEAFVLNITVLVDPSTPNGIVLENCALATSDEGGRARDCNYVEVVTEADLWIDKEGSFITQNPGKNIIYTLTVHNDSGCSVNDNQVCGDGGPSDALDVTVVDTLPATSKKLIVTFVSESCVYDEPSHTVTCETPVLAAGDIVEHFIEVSPRGNLRQIENVATVRSTTADPDVSNNTDNKWLVVGGGGQKGTGE